MLIAAVLFFALLPALGSAASGRPLATDGAAGMVIVTDSSLVAPFARLADVHTRRGLVTRVRTVQSIRHSYPSGRDDAERIRLFLKDARASWGIEFALMGGDEPLIPMRRVWLDQLPFRVRGGAQWLPTDQYYACLDGDWTDDGDPRPGDAPRARPGEPELCVGRAPVTDLKQAEVFVGKTIRALERPASQEPLSALIIAAGSLDPPPRTLPHFAPFAEGIAAWLAKFTRANITRLYRNEGEGAGAKPLTRASARAAICKGADLTFLLGFGGPGSFALDTDSRPETLEAEQLQALRSSRSTGQAIALSAFATVPGRPSVGAALLRDEHGGCVSVLGPTDIQLPSLATAFIEAYLHAGFANHAATVGEAMRSALRGTRIPPSRDSVRLTTLGNVLLGDPGLPFPGTTAGTAHRDAAPVETSGAPPSRPSAGLPGSAP